MTTTRPALVRTVPSAPPGRRRLRALARTRWVWLFVVPALAFYVFVTVVPGVRGSIQAFTSASGNSSGQFVGVSNFTKLFSDSIASSAIIHTLIIAASVTVLQNLIGLLLALGVNSKIKSRRILSAAFFAPAVVMPIVVAYLWQYIYTPGGAASSIAKSVGWTNSPDWLGDSRVALWSIIAVVVWQFSGYSMIIFLAGLQSVPSEVLEAAGVDRAGPVRTLFSIKLPLLGQALLVATMLTLVNSLKMFDLVWVMTQGGPGDATQTLSTLVFQDAFAYNEYGYADAIALLLTVIALPIALFQYRMAGRKGVRA